MLRGIGDRGHRIALLFDVVNLSWMTNPRGVEVGVEVLALAHGSHREQFPGQAEATHLSAGLPLLPSLLFLSSAKP